MLETKTVLNQKELRQFALVWAIFWGLIGAFMWGWTDSLLIAEIIWGINGLIALVGLAKPGFMVPFYRTLMFLLAPVGFVMSHVILGLVYYAVLAPIGLLMRLLGRDTMQKKLDPNAKSYWEPLEDSIEAESYFKQY